MMKYRSTEAMLIATQFLDNNRLKHSPKVQKIPFHPPFCLPLPLYNLQRECQLLLSVVPICSHRNKWNQQKTMEFTFFFGITLVTLAFKSELGRRRKLREKLVGFPTIAADNVTASSCLNSRSHALFFFFLMIRVWL